MSQKWVDRPPTMPRLVRALRECADASDEEQVAAVLATLLVQPQVTKQCEAKEYATVLFDQGFAALVALEQLTVQNLTAMGVSLGHAALVLNAIHTGQGSVAAPAYVFGLGVGSLGG